MGDPDCFGILDSEFDHYLVDMKPYVLKLADKTGENIYIYIYIERERVLCYFHRICKATNKKILLENVFEMYLFQNYRATAVCTVD